MKDSCIRAFGQWISSHSWSDVYSKETAHEKAITLQNILIEKYNFYFPEKTIMFREDDKPWVNQEVKRADRHRRRAWVRDKYSQKYKKLNLKYLDICKKAKENYYQKTINNLKEANISQWYRNIKRISSSNHLMEREVEVEQIKGHPIDQQCELIADKFSEISQLYSSLHRENISVENAKNDAALPPVEPWNVTLIIRDSKAKRSTAPGDFPMKLIKEFNVFLCEPLSDIWKRCLSHGEYPDIWKLEIVTPIPKCFPPKETKDLRKISVTKNFSKLFEKYLCKIIIEDMSTTADKSQYGCKKKIGIQHLLVRLVDRILTALDKNNQHEAYGVILQLVDWSQAFDRQCPKLAIESFIENGVRRSLIPVLINYFQDRKMQVKWKNILSSMRDLPGGGPQGCSLGLESYKSQSNSNADFIPKEDKYKWIDDLSILEIINLLTIGLASYNFKNHVASDVGTDQKFLSTNNIQSQNYINLLCKWTDKMKMKLNHQKSKIMIFNFTKNLQFSTRIKMDNELLEIVQDTTILGLIISNDLSWRKNTDHLVKKANIRLIMLRNLVQVPVSTKDLVMIYCQYIRVILEFNSNVWFSSITKEESQDIERVQKNVCKLLLKNEYMSYEDALHKLNLDSLEERRDKLALKFAKSSTKLDEMNDLFKVHTKSKYDMRSTAKYDVKFAAKSRLFNSAVPTMQRMLNC